jgi:hypothetical protein
MLDVSGICFLQQGHKKAEENEALGLGLQSTGAHKSIKYASTVPNSIPSLK